MNNERKRIEAIEKAAYKKGFDDGTRAAAKRYHEQRQLEAYMTKEKDPLDRW